MEKTSMQHYTVIGGSGAIGAATVEILAEKQLPVKVIARDKQYAEQLFKHLENVTVKQADALNIQQLREALENSQIIFNCINPPYHKWQELLLPIHKNILKVASELNTKLVVADNIYAYGEPQATELAENHPLAATTKKGTLRIKLQQMLLQAHQQGKTQVIIARFGDFFGPNFRNQLADYYFRNPIKGKKGSWIFDDTQPHAFIYTKDAARALVEIALQDDTYGQIWHVAHHEPLTGIQFFNYVQQALNKPVKWTVLKKWQMKLIGLFMPPAKELIENEYQWSRPLLINADKFKQKFPNFRFTPHQQAMQETIQWYQEHS